MTVLSNSGANSGSGSGASSVRATGAATRRRGANLRQAIFDAVFEQLQSVGYANLTMDKVAAAAHTSKTVLYRRWSSKDEMIIEALREALPSPADVPLTGAVRTDVHALLRCIQDSLASTRGTALQVVSAEAGCERGFLRQAIIEHVVAPCIELILGVLRRGAARGEVRPDAACELVAGSGPAMLVQYSLVHGPVVPDDFVATVVDQIVLPLTRPASAQDG